MASFTSGRREFLSHAGAFVAAATLRPAWSLFADSRWQRGPICVFSKHLQWLDYDAMAETAAEIGFEGVALTVRPRGHVLPEEVEDNLPHAVEAIRKAGLGAPMMTTAITDPTDPLTEPILRTASRLGIRHYRMGYLSYDESGNPMDALENHRAMMADLAAMNEHYGIHGAYQNHAGTRVGGPVWDVWHLLNGLDPDFIGCQYDVRHATAEGGTAWPVGMRLLAPYIKITAIKDFHWAKEGDSWRIKNVPMGEGMVDFEKYFEMVRELDTASGPMSMHFEYPLPHDIEKNAGPEVRRQTVEVMKRDVKALKAMLGEI